VENRREQEDGSGGAIFRCGTKLEEKLAAGMADRQAGRQARQGAHKQPGKILLHRHLLIWRAFASRALVPILAAAKISPQPWILPTSTPPTHPSFIRAGICLVICLDLPFNFRSSGLTSVGAGIWFGLSGLSSFN
jgi:hypothetical protein